MQEAKRADAKADAEAKRREEARKVFEAAEVKKRAMAQAEQDAAKKAADKKEADRKAADKAAQVRPGMLCMKGCNAGSCDSDVGDHCLAVQMR